MGYVEYLGLTAFGATIASALLGSEIQQHIVSTLKEIVIKVSGLG